MKGLAGLFIACFISFSIGCGGGSDNKTDPNQNENIESSLTQEDDSQPAEPLPATFTPISEAEFEKLTQVGTWRISSSIRTLEESYNTTPPSKILSNIQTNEVVTSNETSYQFCDEHGVIANSPSEELSQEENLCGDDTNISYLKKDDSHFKASITCKNGNAAEIEISRISNDFGFHLGSLKFLPEKYPAVDTDKNVCANVTFSDVKPLDSAKVNSLEYKYNQEFTAIVILTPYAGSFLQINLTFPWKNKEILKPGIYHVYETRRFFPLKTSDNLVIIQAKQSVLPTLLPPPLYLEATSGTVHIETFDEFEARGTYEFSTLDGEKVTGAFNYSLK